MAGKTEKKIIIEVDDKGGTKIEAVGFPDNTCLKATKSVEEALGVVQDQKLKPEASVKPSISQGLSVGSK